MVQELVLSGCGRHRRQQHRGEFVTVQIGWLVVLRVGISRLALFYIHQLNRFTLTMNVS